MKKLTVLSFVLGFSLLSKAIAADYTCECFDMTPVNGAFSSVLSGSYPITADSRAAARRACLAYETNENLFCDLK